MKFDDLDAKMRKIETAEDSFIGTELYLCARLDGKGFSRFTAENFEKPFDKKFSDLMCLTTEHLMTCGFNILFAYTQSDEISLLFHPDETAFNRKTRKLLTILAGEASAMFSVRSGVPVCFDCRLIPLPTKDDVKDYFAWRQGDLLRNSLDSCCYYALLKDGYSKAEATNILDKKQPDYKTELLKKYGIDYGTLPDWQKYGISFYFTEKEKSGVNQKTGEPITYFRREITSDRNLPNGEKFGDYALGFLERVSK